MTDLIHLFPQNKENGVGKLEKSAEEEEPKDVQHVDAVLVRSIIDRLAAKSETIHKTIELIMKQVIPKTVVGQPAMLQDLDQHPRGEDHHGGIVHQHDSFQAESWPLAHEPGQDDGHCQYVETANDNGGPR